jgi:sugar transferase (PEP-CTERM system associated)
MIRVFNVHFPSRTLFLAVSEALLIFLALLAATFAEFGEKTSAVLAGENGFFKIALAALVCLLCMYYYDLYDSAVLTSPREVVTRLVQVLGTACVALAVLYYIYPEAGLGVDVFLMGIVFVGVVVAGWRRLFFALNRSPRWAERAVFIGEGPLATSLAAEMEKRPELGVRLLGYVSQGTDAAGVNGLPRLGTVEQLPMLVAPRRISRVIVAMNDRRGSLPVEALLHIKTRGILIQDGADVYEAVAGKVALDSLRPSWLLFSPGFRVSQAVLLYKRVFAFVLSLVGLLLTAPLMGIITLAIWLDSGRPVIFRQKRIGKDAQSFILYKFRSMRSGSDADGRCLPAQEKDERFTRVGRWLRRTRLDELPQLYNILRGDMHFVGPRPFVPEQEQECARQIPFYSQRWSVKPGATGWAQIHRGYCATLADNTEKLAYDLFYIKNLSIGLDLLILFQTTKTLLLGRGAR